MNARRAGIRQWVRDYLNRPSREAFRGVLLFNLAAAALVLLVGRPLGDLKHGPFSAATIFHALCSAEILCTAVSFIQLLIVAHLLREIYRLRRQQAQPDRRRGPALLWLLMCIGFFYLAVDEIAFVHEGIDKLIHFVFGIRETPFTDRLDDLIPAAYGLIGLGVLCRYRAELRLFPHFWRWLGTGMLFLFVSVGLDILTHRRDILLWCLADPSLAHYCWGKLNALEEVCKLVAEAVFLGLFLRCRETARRLAEVKESATPPPARSPHLPASPRAANRAA